MSTRLNLRNWSAGSALSANHLQEPVQGLREIRYEIDELKRRLDGIANREATSRSDETEEEQNGTERWKFLESTMVIERIEDADDSDVYIDVTRTTSITVQMPDGTPVLIEFE